MILALDALETPAGPLSLASDGRALVALQFGTPAALRDRLRARFGPSAHVRETPDPQGFASRVRAWFAGDLDALAPVPVDGGGTEFDRRVWAALRTIPPGATVSYAAIAARLGVPRACRAVGRANGRNPIAIVVPCHRVVAADGTLGGYAGGVERKRWLLAHEAHATAGGAAPEPRGATRLAPRVLRGTWR
jgi:methylated-DNA-[protein]-cysteine S-methyltransferase